MFYNVNVKLILSLTKTIEVCKGRKKSGMASGFQHDGIIVRFR